MRLATIAAAWILPWGAIALPAEVPVEIVQTDLDDVQAIALLESTATLLQSTEQFTFAADEQRDVQIDGVYVQVTHELETAVRRPNALQQTLRGDVVRRQFWYDGETATLLDEVHNVYATRADAPETLDGMLDVFAELGVDLPLHQLAYSDLLAKLRDGFEQVYYLGTSDVAGVPCHHLAVVEADIDWQIWIDAGAVPLPRKVAIAYKTIDGTPRYTAVLREWNLTPTLADEQFRATVPDGAERVEFEPVFR